MLRKEQKQSVRTHTCSASTLLQHTPIRSWRAQMARQRRCARSGRASLRSCRPCGRSWSRPPSRCVRARVCVCA